MYIQEQINRAHLSGSPSEKRDCQAFTQKLLSHDDSILKAKNYIRANFTNKIRLKDIARNAHTSLYHLCRIFKRAESTSLHQFLLDARLEYAVGLLIHTTKNIGEIGSLSGFGRQDYFTAAFKKRYKVPPTIYRKNIAGLNQ
jgi:AraC family transcriptional regulator